MKDFAASQTQLMGACFWIVAQDYYVLNKSQHGISGGDLVADQRSSILFTTLVTHLPCRLNTSYQPLTLLKTLFLPDFTFWLYSQCWQYREHSVEIIPSLLRAPSLTSSLLGCQLTTEAWPGRSGLGRCSELRPRSQLGSRICDLERKIIKYTNLLSWGQGCHR